MYEIERNHHFTDLERNIESLKQINYPVRVDFAHKYNEVQQKVVALRNLSGPFFDIELRTHGYTLPKQNVLDLKNLNFPVYEIDREHKYAEIQRNLVEIKNLCGPVRGIF